jgi:hypothetical protein
MSIAQRLNPTLSKHDHYENSQHNISCQLNSGDTSDVDFANTAEKEFYNTTEKQQRNNSRMRLRDFKQVRDKRKVRGFTLILIRFKAFLKPDQ